MARNPLLGRGLSHPLRKAADGNFLRDFEDTSIIQSGISLIMLTQPGERIHQREFGSNLLALKHEPNNPTTHELIKQEIFRSIDRWEPRVADLTVRVEPSPGNRFKINISISYRVIQTNERENFVFPFFLEESGV